MRNHWPESVADLARKIRIGSSMVQSFSLPLDITAPLMNGTGLRQLQIWLVLMDMPHCGRPRKPRPLILLHLTLAFDLFN